MSTIDLHAPPSWRVIAFEQIRVIGLHLRALWTGLVVILVLYGGLVFRVARRAHEANAHSGGHATLNFAYTPEASVTIAWLALFLPCAIWRDEEPIRRAYHWSMPVSRSTHTLTKALAGWVWLIGVTAAWLFLIVSIDALAQRIVGTTSPHREVLSGWVLLVPFTAVTTAYLLGSAAAVGARTPLVWIAGLPTIYFGASLIFEVLGFADGARSMMAAFSGRYGALAAMAGFIRVDREPDLYRWLVVAALWSCVAGILLYAVSSRRSEPA